ncbi:MAG: lanthionine synthetase LanC family protein, partial [Helcococcus sp.]|nr:lanthionine synthetase LanC family protein [Helcococcus sp.]
MKNLNDDLLELVEKFTYSIFNSEDIIEDLQSLGYTENKYSFSEYPSIIIYLSFIYKNKNFNFDDLKILTELCNYIEKLINEIKNTKYIDISLCYGLTGIAYCLKYTFYKTGKFQNILLNIEKTLVDLVNQKLDEVLQIKDTVYESDYDVIEGLASPALYLMDCENNDYHDTIERLLRYFVLLLSRKDNSIHALITPEKMVTENLSKKYPNGYINLSLSHGIASILYILAFAQVRGFNVYKLRESVEFGLKLYMDSIVEYKLNGKNYKFFSSRLLLPNNKLETANNLSWCYGSLGIINILFDIAELHNDSNIMGS